MNLISGCLTNVCVPIEIVPCCW